MLARVCGIGGGLLGITRTLRGFLYSAPAQWKFTPIREVSSAMEKSVSDAEVLPETAVQNSPVQAERVVAASIPGDTGASNQSPATRPKARRMNAASLTEGEQIRDARAKSTKLPNFSKSWTAKSGAGARPRASRQRRGQRPVSQSVVKHQRSTRVQNAAKASRRSVDGVRPGHGICNCASCNDPWKLSPRMHRPHSSRLP
eukprot:jgi/Mesvir1/27900/Mv26149-RA.1